MSSNELYWSCVSRDTRYRRLDCEKWRSGGDPDRGGECASRALVVVVNVVALFESGMVRCGGAGAPGMIGDVGVVVADAVVLLCIVDEAVAGAGDVSCNEVDSSRDCDAR